MSEELNPMGSAGARDKDAPEGGRFKGRKRRKVSYLTINKIYNVDYKEVNVLRRFINERGKMVPSRQTGNTAKQQRMIARAIRRARELALLPFVVTDIPADTRTSGYRRERRYDRGDERQYDQRPRASAEAPAAEATAPVEAPASEATAEATE